MRIGAPAFAAGETTSFDRMTGSLYPVIAIALAIFIVLLILVVGFSYLRRRKVEKLGQLPPDELLHWRTSLVELVGEASQTRGAHISLHNFWRKTGLTAPQKYVALKPLLAQQVFYPAYSSDKLVASFQRIRWNLLHFPVSFVRLSDLNWQKLASGESAGIVASGDVIFVQNSPGTGIMSRSKGGRQTIKQEWTPTLVHELASALRHDAMALRSGHPLREQAESYADTLERDVSANRWESVKRTANDVLEFAANGAGFWAATLTILGVR